MIAVIVATKREADAVRGVLPPDAVLFRSGVGKVNAAVAAMSAAWAGAEAVVNAGLAGGMGAKCAAGSAWCVSEAVQCDVDISAVDNVKPGTVDGRPTPFFRLDPVPGLPSARIGTADRFAATEADRDALRRFGCGLADMECAAVAQVCERAHIPVFAVKVVSDGCDGGEYGANADGCLARLADAMMPAVEEALDAAKKMAGKM